MLKSYILDILCHAAFFDCSWLGLEGLLLEVSLVYKPDIRSGASD